MGLGRTWQTICTLQNDSGDTYNVYAGSGTPAFAGEHAGDMALTDTAVWRWNGSSWEDLQEGAPGMVSTSNSTSTPLAGGGTFTGAWEDVLAYASISIACTVTPSNATGTVYADFSPDGVNVDSTVSWPIENGSIGVPHFLSTSRRYFRVRVVNDGVAQSAMRLQTLLYPVARLSLPTTRVTQTFTNDSDAISTRAVLTGQDNNGETYANVGISERDALNVEIAGPVTAFGEVLQQMPLARVQIDAVYGLVSTDVETFSDGTGVVSNGQSMFSCSIGAGLYDYAVVRSKRTIRYLPGQGIRVRGTADFTTPAVANAIQLWGLFTSSDGLFFGQNTSGVFGILRRIAGSAAIYRLTITNGATGAENMTITLNGVASVVASGGALTANQTAERIAELGSFAGWASSTSPTSNGATITFIQGTPGPTPAAFTFASTGGATGTFAQIQAGAANDDTTGFVPQSLWNVDKCDGSRTDDNPSGFNINWDKLNVFEVVHPYLGAGTIRFRVMAPNGKMITVHRIEYPSSAIIPNQRNPSFRVGWICASLGSTTPLVVKGASASGFIEGEAQTMRDPYGYDVQFQAQTTEYYCLALRARGEFASVVNQRIILPMTVILGLSASNRAVRARVYVSPTLNGAVNWQYIDQSLSSMEYAVGASGAGAITPSGGRLVATTVASSGGIELDLKELDLRLEPGDTLVISLLALGGTADCFAGINWQEV